VAVKIRAKNGKWWLYVDWHGQRKKKCIGTKEAAEKARVMLEARLVLGVPRPTPCDEQRVPDPP
jgi:hypothetical protein